MDEIQKVLIKSGRKDLAQEYHKKISEIKIESNLKNILKKIKEIFEIENVEQLPKSIQQRLIEETVELLKFDPTKNKYILTPKIAKQIISQFTITKPLKIKEDGSTRTSIKNMKLIKEAGYSLKSAIMFYDKTKGNYHLTCTFIRNNDTVYFTFKGFSIGYGGEGPHGLDESMKLFGINKSNIILGDIKTPNSGDLILL